MALAAMAMQSCSEDFLNVESPDKLYVDEFYKTQDRIFEDLVAAYDPLQWFDWAMGQYNPINVMSDIMGDQMWPGGASRSDNEFWHLMNNFEAIPTNCMEGIWTDCYSGVKRCNDVLFYIEGVENISEDAKALYIAEAKVLRAFYYTQLWKFWGNVPYYTKNLESPYTCAQSSADEVYKGILTDLNEAIAANILPMKAKDKDAGRVTLAMTYMLYTEVVMYQNDQPNFGTALKYMEQIINSGEYELMRDYNAIWERNGEWSSESIWEINYMNEGASRSWGWPQGAGGTVLPRLISPNGWTDGKEGIDNGWGFCPIRKEVAAMYEDGDSRKEATLMDVSAFDYTKRYEDTGYFLKKYIARSGYNAGQIADGDLNFGNNLRIYRYSECLLNAAELITRGAGSGDAAKYLNMVRARAGVGNISADIDNILQERAMEFVGEGKRYWDLVRSGKAASTLVPDADHFRTNTWSEHNKYLPIPQSEINRSQGTLSQNKGY